MAKYRSNRSRARRESPRMKNTTLIMIILVVIGFMAGFYFARIRYLNRIEEISVMNMQRAVSIDELKEQLQVLGASIESEE